MRKLIYASLFFFSISANAELINGDFETGDFTGWTATNNGVGSCDTDWNVGSTGFATGCTGIADPNGTYAAYNSFDGNGPQEFTLSQTIGIENGLSSAILSWEESYDLSFSGSLSRIFDVTLFDSSDNFISTLFSEDFVAGFHSSNGWVSNSVDITNDLLAFQGQNVTISFSNYIPEIFTGPAGFGLDNVSLTTTASVPEPASMLLLGLGLAGLGFSRKKKNA